MDFLTEIVLQCKRTLDDITYSYFVKTAKYIDIELNKDGVALLLILKLLSPQERHVKWSENMTDKIVPATEPETRICSHAEWASLDYPNEARMCLQSIMGKYDVWDVDDLSKFVASKNDCHPVLCACLKVLKDKSESFDREIIRNYNSKLASINRRKTLLKKIKANREIIRANFGHSPSVKSSSWRAPTF